MMKLKLTGNVVANWVEGTINEIKELLMAKGIPFTESFVKDDGEFIELYFYTHQLLFPWCEGDVVVGTLHCFDDEVVKGRVSFTYPSIETYHFPWDEGDITVFNTPEEFVAKLEKYYDEKKKEAM